MLSIIDLKDYLDLDIETVHVVRTATQLSMEESIALARQFLASEQGRATLHHMYRDQIADAAAASLVSLEKDLRRAYGHFSRKYQMPQIF